VYIKAMDGLAKEKKNLKKTILKRKEIPQIIAKKPNM
jgi:hypothetical protein